MNALRHCAEVAYGACKHHHASKCGTHSCLYCEKRIHAICRRAPTAEEVNKFAPGKDIEGYEDIRSGKLVSAKRTFAPSNVSRSDKNLPEKYKTLTTSSSTPKTVDGHGNQRAPNNEHRLQPSGPASVSSADKEGNEDIHEKSARHGSGNVVNNDYIEDADDDTSDSDSLFGSDEEYLESSGDDGEKQQPYAWVEIPVRSKKVDTEIDDLDSFSARILIEEAIHVLKRVSERLSTNVESLLQKPPSAKKVFDLLFNSNVLNVLQAWQQ
ncbi:hypothetical protein FGB62_104g114 [Gracilaria domingensis]|nr:hypothetical protein FGB62_104g114 [Gracilaria domingensis]